MDTLQILQIVYWVVALGFIVYQSQHSDWHRTPNGIRVLITINSSLFSIGAFVYLIFWGINISWVGAIILFVAAMFHPIVFAPISKLLGKLGGIYISFLGLIALPVLAYFLYVQFPPFS
jgi:hypothetical protein